MRYEIPSSAFSNRFFSSKALYSQIDWSSLSEIVLAYGQRIEDWYLEPARTLASNIHFAFAVMALDCLLIDALSKYLSGSMASERDLFKGFVRDELPPDYSQPLPAPIKHYDGGREATLNTVADAIYHGFRCGIHHQAHMPPYCGVDPSGQRVSLVPEGLVRYRANGGPCPSVVVNPLALHKDLDSRFRSYTGDLLDAASGHDQLRDNFKAVFTANFGIDVRSAVL